MRREEPYVGKSLMAMNVPEKKPEAEVAGQYGLDIGGIIGNTRPGCLELTNPTHRPPQKVGKDADGPWITN